MNSIRSIPLYGVSLFLRQLKKFAFNVTVSDVNFARVVAKQPLSSPVASLKLRLLSVPDIIQPALNVLPRLFRFGLHLVRFKRTEF